jgi:hypothetical protein
MVDSINGGAQISSLLRAQSASTVALKNSQQANQAIIDQLQKPTAPVKATAVTQSNKLVSASSNLPRGSIVDKLV